MIFCLAFGIISSLSMLKKNFKNWIAAIAKYKSIDYKRNQMKRLKLA